MEKPRIIDFPKLTDKRGCLTFIEYPKIIPFEISRVFWIYDVPSGEMRGGHAYYQQEELIIALSGSFEVVITNPDGSTLKYSLNRPNYGLFLPKLTWRHIENFSTNSLGLHLSNRIYSEVDYIRDFEIYCKTCEGL